MAAKGPKGLKSYRAYWREPSKTAAEYAVITEPTLSGGAFSVTGGLTNQGSQKLGKTPPSVWRNVWFIDRAAWIWGSSGMTGRMLANCPWPNF